MARRMVLRSIVLAGLCLSFLSRGSWAQTTGPGVTLHGFGGWAAGYSDNENQFAKIADKELAFSNYYFALNTIAQPTEALALHTQVHWHQDLWGAEAHVDHAFVNWSPERGLTLRAGKIKNPLGIYTDIFDVGTLRPFYLLPQGLYADVPEGYVGVGTNLQQKLGRWEVVADLIGGQMEFQESREDLMVGVHPLTGLPVWATLGVHSEGRDFIGGGFFVRPPIDGLELGASAYSINVWTGVGGGEPQRSGTKRTNVVAGTGEFLRDKIILRAEGMRVTGDSEIDAFFAEGAYKLTDHWQVALSFDWRERTKPPMPVSDLGDHRSIGLALNYWIHPTVVAKLNYYNVTGNRLARPSDAVNVALAGKLDNKTQVVIFGTQFAF
jgi:hypothetical protein